MQDFIVKPAARHKIKSMKRFELIVRYRKFLAQMHNEKMASIILIGFILLLSMECKSQENPLEPPVSYTKMKLPDGSNYFGQVESGELNGIGSIITKSGTANTGYFQDGEYLADFIATPPWHMIAIDYQLDTSYLLETFEIELKIHTEISDSLYLYIAPIGGGQINGQSYYGGIQTHCGGYNSIRKNENYGEFSEIGRAMIFSRWGDRRGEALKQAPGGKCESSGYEGDFISVRNGINWGKGTYTISLVKTKETVVLDSVLHTFVEMRVFDHKQKKLFVCGSLAFPGTDLILDPRQ
ncbi:MAG: hypothetical protein EBU61_06460, partial [Crocinitomicaceae bacterium]|nr:hypothetical protein [Crocinitomicaceae bacterium]